MYIYAIGKKEDTEREREGKKKREGKKSRRELSAKSIVTQLFTFINDRIRKRVKREGNGTWLA